MDLFVDSNECIVWKQGSKDFLIFFQASSIFSFYSASLSPVDSCFFSSMFQPFSGWGPVAPV